MKCPFKDCMFEMSPVQWNEQFFEDGIFTCPQCGQCFDLEDVNNDTEEDCVDDADVGFIQITAEDVKWKPTKSTGKDFLEYVNNLEGDL